MWELNYKESWVLKNWCFWTVVLKKTLESPLDCKEIQPVHPKRNQSWIFIGRTDAESEMPILWAPDAKNWLTHLTRPWCWERLREGGEGATEDEMVGWHHWLNGHKFWETPGVGGGQGGLACCSPWGRKESDTTERLNWTDSIKAFLWLVHPILKCLQQWDTDFYFLTQGKQNIYLMIWDLPFDVWFEKSNFVSRNKPCHRSLQDF